MITKTRVTYSAETAQRILAKVNEKGWNAYKSTDVVKTGGREVIEKHLAERLELDERYVMLPKIDEPRNAVKVMVKLEQVAMRLNRMTPTISISGMEHPWTGFILRGDHVKVNTASGHYMSYPEFIEALDTIIQV